MLLLPKGFAVVASQRADARLLRSVDGSLPGALQALWPERFPTPSAAKKACRRSLVRVNGEAPRRGEALSEDADCELHVIQRVVAGPGPGEGRRRATASPLRVVFEDDHFAVVWKPAGLPVQGRAGDDARTLLASSIQPSRCAAEAPLWRPQHVHRLDAPTCGLLVAAKTTNSLSALCAAFASPGSIQKTYTAVVAGDATGDGGDSLRTIRASLSGKEARTDWQPIATYPSAAWGAVTHVRLWPRTGRTHQLRRHLATIGHPIVGDERYWPRDERRPRHENDGLFLCAGALALSHPHSGRWMEVRADEPERFVEFCEQAAG